MRRRAGSAPEDTDERTGISYTNRAARRRSHTDAPSGARGSRRGTGGQQHAARVEVTARNFRFSVSEITVPAGAQVTVRFTNRDEGIPHNISFYRSESAGEVFYKGQVIQGNGRIEYSFTAPERPGRYFFRCDIHPVQMNGVFVVE
jgi:plastocyanin